jgi:rfaE bifunctional protein kinase chain/domain
MDKDLIKTIIQNGRGCNTLVIGDLMLDEWIKGVATRISPEAPVPIVKVEYREAVPGGAANVATNLAALGANVTVAGFIGDDHHGEEILEILKSKNINCDGIFKDFSSPTTLKTRIVAHNQQMLRVDKEDCLPFSDFMQNQLLDFVISGSYDLVVFSDYDKGTIHNPVVSRLKRHTNRVLSGGPKPSNIDKFADFDFISLNLKEAKESFHNISLNSPLNFASKSVIIEEIGGYIRKFLNITALAVTRGDEGASLFTEKGHELLTGHTVEVFDVAGAGDTFLAAASFSLAAGHSLKESCCFANLAAASSVRQHGVVAVGLGDILQEEREESLEQESCDEDSGSKGGLVL